ncbi:hypothetical protein G7Z17_g10993 [Cylindrodendrum hubeiense]|uniref:Polyketide synthase n=1 Tax=Cylindrodendrum hubeiense TaxID=595255 RepID=A0A9P5H0E5_9HYPO|nr:hypothetical protein G7Z17_g10993 [Cylindrodendrum hubeiense]
MSPHAIPHDIPTFAADDVGSASGINCTDNGNQPVAIVGLGMRLPGGVHTAEALWKTIAEKQSTRCEIPPTRFNLDGFHGESGQRGCISMRHGHFLNESSNFRHLDTSFFSMVMKEVGDIDPQQRMLLEVVYECMQTSGEPNWRGSKIGCYVGVWGEDWLDLQAKDTHGSGIYRSSGGHDFALSNRISYEYDLKGPSFTMKSACSSSLIALHEAVRALRAGDCDGAIVAGTNLIFSPTMYTGMSEQGVLSPSGYIKTFDAAADGYARGEAVNALYLKPLSDALRDGDPIRAVIRGTASNFDGKTPGMTNPSSEGQEALIRRTYKEAGLDPSQTPYVEAHGTGTAVGDLVEASTIARVFGGTNDRTLHIGSVKPNFGHSEGASAITSILKAVLALEHKMIPPNINFSTPNPKIPFREYNMEVPVDLIPWSQDQPLRISVNSFGIGGANAHCIIESAEQYLGKNGTKTPGYGKRVDHGHRVNNDDGVMNGQNANNVPINEPSNGHHDGNGSNGLLAENGQNMGTVASNSVRNVGDDTKSDSKQQDTQETRPRKVLHVLSAMNPDSLKRSLAESEKYYRAQPDKAADISYTLCNRREHLTNRAYCVADNQLSLDEDAPALDFSPLSKLKTTVPTVNMIFTGQGAQWAGMAKELMDDYPIFQEDIVAMSHVLSQLEHPPAWNLVDELRKSKSESNLALAEFSQPLVCVIQVALVNLLRSWGIQPAAVIGHSSGEIVAAYAAGAISSEEAITIAYYRGYVTKGYPRRGGMAAIGLGPEQVAPFLVDGVVVGCENSPNSVTLSGDKEALETVCDNIKREKPECLVRMLKVEMAYHSHHMLDIGPLLELLLQDKVDSKSPAVPFFSSVKGKQLKEPGSFNASYWRENFESPVRFSSAVRTLVDTQPSSSEQLFIEIGPHSALAGPLRQILSACGRTKYSYASAMIRGGDCTQSALALAGELYLQGVSINLAKISPVGDVVTDLPLYPWQHDKEYWAESRLSQEWRFRKFPNHELLGSRTLESTDLSPQWRNVFLLDDVPWLRDHQIIDDVIFPYTGYLGMAGEAIRQLSGYEDLTMRNVVVHTALVLSESKSVEMVTSLQPVRLTNMLDSTWWDFKIVSHNGSNWVKNCDGQIRGGGTAEQVNKIHAGGSFANGPHLRAVEDYYPSLWRIGLHYGPFFKGLERVLCLPNQETASATLSTTTVSRSKYAMHPTTMDHCLGLFLASTCKGLFHDVKKLCVPTEIGELYIAGGRDFSGGSVEVHSVTASTGAVSGSATVTPKGGGAVLLSITEAKFSPLETNLEGDMADPVAAARLDWKPSLDFANMHNLIRPSESSRNDGNDIHMLEKLVLVSILEIKERIANMPAATKSNTAHHVQRFCAWIQMQVAQAAVNSYRGLEVNSQHLTRLSREDRLALMTELQRSTLETSAASAAALIGRIVQNCEDIVQGNISGIEVLQPDDGLTNYYNWFQSRTDAADFFTVAGHTRPTMRVLEIGAGTGGSTAIILKSLQEHATAERLYSKYVYSDISSGFFVAAQERFAAYQEIDFRVLDISKDPLEQGFTAGSFDLIIAANVLHATPSLQETLANVRKLLAPEGYLFLQELAPKMNMVNLIMGILPGWWLGEQEGRVDEPFLMPEHWDEALKQSGFSGVDAAIYDAPQPHQINANIISRPAVPNIPVASTGESHRQISLLHLPGDENSSSVLRIRENLGHNGFKIDMVSLDQLRQQEFHFNGQLIVSVLELEHPFFDNISASELEAFQGMVNSLETARILWITRQAQRDIGAESNPGFGLSVGLARTLRSEQSVSITTLEIDHINDAAYAAISGLVDKMFLRDAEKFHENGTSSESRMDPDHEFVLLNGVLEIPRYHPVILAQDMAKKAPKPEAVKLDVGRPGLLQSLRWAEFPTREPADDEIVIEPRCTGLNFRDILVCMGIIEATDIEIGLEGSGVVVQVGAKVTGLRPGDRVFYLEFNCFSTRMTISAKQCAKIPPTLSWEQAATVPCVYATVIHSFLDVGGLKPGQSVLIHSACGGVGIAALNVCQSIGGLEIYATVGNEEKVQYLMDTFGLPRERIFNSRDATFLSDVQDATGGRGVDIVLNSLSGELLHASWQCVAPFGKMIEIGKRDFIGKAQLNMDVFAANRTFVGVDITKFDAATCHSLLLRTANMLSSGQIRPIEPMKVFCATEIEDSFRYMQKGIHLGKIVVSIPEQGQGLSMTLKAPKPVLKASASYLLVGGLGGLGRAVATWMVELGARHLIFFSRSAGQKDSDKAFFRELRFQGCIAQAIQGDVSNLGDVERAMAAAPRSRPMRGVLQMSMVLRDKPFINMDHDDWAAAVAPKVQGSWNLHRAAPKDLDFFFAAGSISGSFGNPGQANYAAGNTYMTALVQHRRALGLPASVLHIGAMEDTGYLAQNPTKADAIRAAGGYFLRTKELLQAMHWALMNSSADSDAEQLAIGVRYLKSLSDPTNRATWGKDPRMAVYHNREVSGDGDSGGGGDSGDALRLFMASVEADPGVLDDAASQLFLTREICANLYIFVLRPVEEDMDTSVTMTSLGVDSLVTIELRNWMKQVFGGIELSTLEILNAATADGLGVLVMTALKARFAEK